MRSVAIALATFVMLAVQAGAKEPSKGGAMTTASATAFRGEPLLAHGQAQIPGVGPVKWEYHYDRNSLRDTRPLAGGWIALTGAGNLLLFDPDLVQLRGEYFGPSRVTCLGADDKGAVVAGFEDGRIMAVDPTTLALSSVATVQGAIVAIGYRASGWVVAHAPPPAPTGNSFVHTGLMVTDLGKNKVHRLKTVAPTSLYFDRHDRLWLGVDHGEFEGGASVLDLGSGALREIDVPSNIGKNVYGFTELADGQVWAYGGTMHMGLLAWHITRVDSARAETMAAGDNLKDHGAKMSPGPPSIPRFPITQILEDRNGDLLVFSYSDLFRVDRALLKWRYVMKLDLNYRPGRPDAVGSYPAISRVVPFAKHRERLVLVTGGNGNVILDGSKISRRELPGQLGLRSQDEVLDSPAGLLVLSHDDRERPWALKAGHWERAEAEPPKRYHFADPFSNSGKSWWEVRLLRAPSGALYAISANNVSPGTRAVDRWDKEGFVPISTSLSSFTGRYCFFTPDGELWARDFGPEFLRLVGDHWIKVGAPPRQTEKIDSPYAGYLKPLVLAGPPWLYFNGHGNDLVSFSPGKQSSTPRMEPVALSWQKKPLAIHDALAEPDGTVLLATERGLFRYDPRTGGLAETAVVASGEPVQSLARDGQGRLWLTGSGVKVLLPGTTTATAILGLPLGDDRDTRILGTDPSRPDGVALGLQERGIMFVEIAKQ